MAEGASGQKVAPVVAVPHLVKQTGLACLSVFDTESYIPLTEGVFVGPVSLGVTGPTAKRLATYTSSRTTIELDRNN